MSMCAQGLDSSVATIATLIAHDRKLWVPTEDEVWYIVAGCLVR